MTRIVVLDDDPLTEAELVHALRAHGELDVLEPATPARAVDMVIAQDIAVFVCSAEVHGESGIELLAQVRSLSYETICILTVERVDPSVLLEAINVAGAFRCLVQPLPSAAIVAHVEEAIREHHRRAVLRSLISPSAERAPADSTWET